MKLLFTSLACILALSLQAQTTFWTEDFGTGCNRGQLASAYTGTNGAWTITSTGTNGNVANTWYVSGTAAGTSVGNCNDNCIFSATTNQSLHLSNVSVVVPGFFTVGADTGSSYFSGGLSAFGYVATTHRRAESPVINCTGRSNITVGFLYYENGELTDDDATLWYSPDGGTSWSQINAMAKTVGGCPAVLGGTWNAFNVALPASADNNPNVKIGFNWVNDDDGNGTDPSFAVDDIVVQENTGGGPTITTGSVSSPYCAGSNLMVPYTITGTFTAGNIFTAQLSDGAGSFASPTNIGTLASTASGSINSTIPASTPAGGGYLIRVISSTPSVTGTSSSAFSVNPLPTVIAGNTGPYCQGNTINLTSSGGTDYDWVGPNAYVQTNTQNPTISSSTVAMSGVYTVTVTDINSCSNTATTTVSVVDCSGIENQELDQTSLYPNPSTDNFTISIHENMINECTISMVNMVGETVYSAVPTQQKTLLNKETLGLRAGIYLVKINYMTSNKVIKLIVR